MSQHRPIKVPSGVHPVVKLLFEEINNQELSLDEITTKASVDSSTLRKWRLNKGRIDIHTVSRLFRLLGYKLTVEKL